MLEWQYGLEAQDGVREQQSHRAEKKHGERIMLPVLLLVGIDARKPICQTFDRLDDVIEEGPSVRVEHFA